MIKLIIMLAVIIALDACTHKPNQDENRNLDLSAKNQGVPPLTVEYICPEGTMYHQDFLSKLNAQRNQHANKRSKKSRRHRRKKKNQILNPANDLSMDKVAADYSLNCLSTKITFASGKTRTFNNDFTERADAYQFTRFRKATSRYLIVDTAFYEGGSSTLINMLEPHDELMITAWGEPILSPNKKRILINGVADEAGYTQQHFDIISFEDKGMIHEVAIYENPDFSSQCAQVKKCIPYFVKDMHLDKFDWESETKVKGQACPQSENGLNYKKCIKLTLELQAGEWIPSW